MANDLGALVEATAQIKNVKGGGKPPRPAGTHADGTDAQASRGSWGKGGGWGSKGNWGKGDWGKGAAVLALLVAGGKGGVMHSIGQGGSVPQSAGAATTEWKKELNVAYARKHKTPPPKNTFTYAVEGDVKAGFVSSVTCQISGNQTAYSGEAQASKKAAENDAAKSALKSEFPMEFAKASLNAEPAPGIATKAGGKAGGTNAALAAVIQSLAGGGAAWPAQSSKPKTGPLADPKSKLNAGLQMIAGKPITKADVVYTTEGSGEKITAKLAITCLEKEQVFQGEGTSKKLAEANAAETALSQLQTRITEAQSVKAAKPKETKATKAAAETKAAAKAALG